MKCKVISCGRSDKSDPGLHFYRFPKDPAVRRKWIEVCVGNANEEDIPFFKLSPHSRICSIHFPNGKRNPNGTWNIPTDVAPLDDEMEIIENAESDCQTPEHTGINFAPVDNEWQGMNTSENVGDQRLMREGDTLSYSFSDSNSSQSRLRCEVFRLRERVSKLKRLICRWRSRYGNLVARRKKEDSNSFEVAKKKVFNDDQLKLLSGKVRQVKQWSEATVTDSLQIRFACQGGYDKLIKRGYPLPSTRTLLRRIADVHFHPGSILFL